MVTPRSALLACEVVSVVLGLAGVALVYVPAALVLGGLAGVLACERALADRRVAGERRGGDAAGGERQ
ncbi:MULTISPECIES: hypothetical protein [unclassified Streptomyces]|uniref:hypothetical protein n=1 Tax=unclassified Streptomyces TaxID=2593676 RepID=UPI001CD4075F|nr:MULTISPECIES: hypothetical protein [unclassified Streptomyces]